MSDLYDDIARGCLENGEPIEARWGSGWWSAQPDQEQPPTDMDIWNDLQRQNDQLRAENERLKKALREIVSPFESYDDAFIYGNIKSKNSNIDTFIEEFRNGRNIWSRASIELAVREIERLRKENHKLKMRLEASENHLVLMEVNEMLKKTQARVPGQEAMDRLIEHVLGRRNAQGES